MKILKVKRVAVVQGTSGDIEVYLWTNLPNLSPDQTYNQKGEPLVLHFTAPDDKKTMDYVKKTFQCRPKVTEIVDSAVAPYSRWPIEAKGEA